MWKQKIGISLGNGYTIPTADVIGLVKQIGFDAVSPVWSAKADMEAVYRAAKEQDMILQSLHAPFGKAAAMWSREESICAPAKEELMQALADCQKHRIPVMVVHVWIGFDDTFSPEKLYFGNFDTLVAAAQACGVKLAFENTEGEAYLFALMDHYKGNETVGFCWDSGHEMCYNHSRDLLKLFGDRLIMTHLNDNLGISRFDGKTYWTDDLHLLPYDGIMDWQDAVDRLKRARPLEILNFELNIQSKPGRHENDIYAQMDLTGYFTEAYKRACRIAYNYSRQE